MGSSSFKFLLARVLNLLIIASVIAGQFFIVTSPVRAASVPPIQVFYLKMPEDLVLNSYKKIYTSSAGPMHSVTGISITAKDTLIYYDQWENGFGVDLSNPANLWSSINPGGTQIWGDKNAANGCAPNVDGRTGLVCIDANDTLNAGNVIVLENDVPMPRNNSSILFDGRDKIGSTKVISITRSVWAATPGTVLTDAIEVYDTTRWEIGRAHV